MSIRILLQTTLLSTEEDDWTIARFQLLSDYLTSLTDERGNSLCQVTARDRQPDAQGNDPVLSDLDRQDFDELWLFALDVGGGLSDRDLTGIARFHQRGGGILATRDHQDMGISMCGLDNIGCFHYFHTQQIDPDESRCRSDDCYTTYISWPNYHSGRNGDYQTIQPVEPLHDLLKNPASPTGTIQFFPAHPHEGGIGVPANAKHARVIATGKSQVTGREFNLAVAAERVDGPGRVVAQSTFHHFVDYNWDISKGCPSFVDEPPGEGMQKEPQALADIQCYVKNLALWLTPTNDQ
ncbi:MAG: hypothetical protein IGR93_15650 [Hydrococcus sp. C42_A2020_068]|nr:hypothetical protein [Hydrococcus sp. C42_A2020_068]